MNQRFFADLRALRDEFKYRVSYVVFTREVLPRLCQKPECDEFVELLSPNIIGLGPYDHDDSWILLRNMANRYSTTPDPALGERLIAATGGHPGLLKAAYMAVLRGSVTLPNTDSDSDMIPVLLQDMDVKTECRKLWQSIGEDERRVLSTITAGGYPVQSEQDVLPFLRLKRLITEASDG